MATIKPTETDVSDKQDGSAFQYVWTPVTNADTCAAIRRPAHADRSVHVSGTFNGASVAVNGSNETGGTNAVALNDPGGTAIAITAAGAKLILENMLYYQPAATGGGGSQSLTISMLVRMTNPLRT